MPRLLPFIALILSAPLASAQEALSRKFSAEQCIHVIDDAAEALTSYHPGLYRYHPEQYFNRRVDSIKASVKAPLTELELYRKLKPLVSGIGCLHTELVTALNYKGYLDDRPNLLPFRLYFDGDRAFVIKNYSGNKAILPGDELISINGRSVPAMLAMLLPAIPSDGYNLTMKYRSLYHSFPTWYRSIIEVTDTFSIAVAGNGGHAGYKISAAKKSAIEEDGFLREIRYPRQLTFKIENNTGFLSVHTFANSAIKKGGQQFRAFIDNAFREMNAKGIPNLIIDLRYNTGGSDANAAYLCSYFFDRPYRYWSRIEVTDKIAHKIRGLASLWYRKPVYRDSMWLWQKAKRVNDFDFYEEQQPAPSHYTGKTYILINGFCMSSCADLAAVLSYNKKAVFIGEETGGGFQGNNSGIMPGVNLKPTKMVLTVPLQEYFTAVDPAANAGSGTVPDYPVKMTLNDVLQNTDKPMEAALELVRKDLAKEK
jgi:hypothetical protein